MLTEATRQMLDLVDSGVDVFFGEAVELGWQP